jgi:hypothetical protein
LAESRSATRRHSPGSIIAPAERIEDGRLVALIVSLRSTLDEELAGALERELVDDDRQGAVARPDLTLTRGQALRADMRKGADEDEESIIRPRASRPSPALRMERALPIPSRRPQRERHARLVSSATITVGATT